MAKPLSMDLRERVLACIVGGVSGRQAAERFGVSAASVSRWRTREREQGDAQPRAQGGDRKSHRIDTHRATIMALLGASPDITIEELRHKLSEQGLSIGYGTTRRFFERHKITRKKDCPCRGAGSSGRLEGPRGLAREPGQARPGIGSSSLMRPGHRPTWRAHMAVARAENACGPAFLTATGKQQLA